MIPLPKSCRDLEALRVRLQMSLRRLRVPRSNADVARVADGVSDDGGCVDGGSGDRVGASGIGRR